MKEQIWWFIAACIYLAILYALVRPGSTGTQLVTNVLSTLTDLVRGATGFTYDKTTQKWQAPGSGNDQTTVA